MATQPPVQRLNDPTVYLRDHDDNRKKLFTKLTKKRLERLAIAQICLGIISILCQILMIKIFPTSHGSYILERYREYEEIYCGIIFVFAGFAGLLASHKFSTCNINTFITLSIIAAVFSVAQIILAFFSVAHNPFFNEPKTEICLVSAMMFASFVEAVIAMVSSAVCFRVTCCIGKPVIDLSNEGQVQVVQEHLPNGVTDQAYEVEHADFPVPSAPPAPQDQDINQLPSYEEAVQWGKGMVFFRRRSVAAGRHSDLLRGAQLVI